MEAECLTSLASSLKGRAAELAEETERTGCTSKEIVEGLRKGGFFRGFQTKRFGGLEVHPADFFGAIVEMATACPSTAWIMGIMGIHQFELARLPVELQEEILGDDPDTLISSSYSPQGKVTQVSGGYRLSGQWKSSSGVDHASWVVLGGNLAPAEGDGPPAFRIFYVPVSDLKLYDDWDVMGLRGTGSKSVILDDVFVPEHRSAARGGFTGGGSASSPTSDSSLYRLPQGLMYLLPGSAPAIGTAKGAFAEYRRQMGKRRPRLDGSSMMQDPLVQKRIAFAKYSIETAELRLMQSINEMMATVESGEEITPEAQARYAWDFMRPADDCLSGVRSIFETMGASVVYSSNPLQRYYRDLLTIRQHGTQDTDRGALGVAKAEMGS